MLRVGLIGYGYWGPNLLRNMFEAPGGRVVAVSDKRRERLAAVEARYPGIRTTTDAQEVIGDPDTDAIAIATPVSTHHALAMAALREGKHVLVTKPLAASVAEAEAIVEEAERRSRVLLVDHTFLYTGAVRKIRELLRDQQLGAVHYYDAVRVNLGLFQHDVNVLWDLAVHDLSILDYVLPCRPRAVSAVGMSHVEGRPENIAYLTLFYPDRFIAHVHVNWLAPVKLRRTLIGGSQRMIVYDDLEPSEKVKVYDSGIVVSGGTDVYKMLIDYRTGDMWAPKVARTEALQTEVADFFQCILTGERPTSDGAAGLRLVRLLTAATRSLEAQGTLVEVGPQ